MLQVLRTLLSEVVMKFRPWLALAVFVVAAACSDSKGIIEPEPESGDIELSAAQATAIKNRIVQLAPLHPELSWLADSISLVIGAGATIDEVPVTTNLGDGPFYAVSLQRAITTSFSGSSAFDVIMFDNPSNPTNFMIVGGWTNPGAGTPPTTVTGSFGETYATKIVTGHFFHVEGQTVTSWRVDGGSATLASGLSTGTCESVANTATVTCQQAIQNSAFTITSASSQTSSEVKTASLAATDVSGIIIRMNFPD